MSSRRNQAKPSPKGKDRTQVMLPAFVDPFTNPNIGRWTGVDVKAGKNIRKDEHGFENFDDYWTESENDESRSSIADWLQKTSEPSKEMFSYDRRKSTQGDKRKEYALEAMESFTPSTQGNNSAVFTPAESESASCVTEQEDDNHNIRDKTSQSEAADPVETESSQSEGHKADDGEEADQSGSSDIEEAAQSQSSNDEDTRNDQSSVASTEVTFSKTNNTVDTTTNVIQPGNRTKLHDTRNSTVMAQSQTTLNLLGNGTGTITRMDKSPALTHSRIMLESPHSAVSSFKTRKRLTYSREAGSLESEQDLSRNQQAPRRSTRSTGGLATQTMTDTEGFLKPVPTNKVTRPTRSSTRSSSGSRDPINKEPDERRTSGRGRSRSEKPEKQLPTRSSSRGSKSGKKKKELREQQNEDLSKASDSSAVQESEDENVVLIPATAKGQSKDVAQEGNHKGMKVASPPASEKEDEERIQMSDAEDNQQEDEELASSCSAASAGLETESVAHHDHTEKEDPVSPAKEFAVEEMQGEDVVDVGQKEVELSQHFSEDSEDSGHQFLSLPSSQLRLSAVNLVDDDEDDDDDFEVVEMPITIHGRLSVGDSKRRSAGKATPPKSGVKEPKRKRRSGTAAEGTATKPPVKLKSPGRTVSDNDTSTTSAGRNNVSAKRKGSGRKQKTSEDETSSTSADRHKDMSSADSADDSTQEKLNSSKSKLKLKRTARDTGSNPDGKDTGGSGKSRNKKRQRSDKRASYLPTMGSILEHDELHEGRPASQRKPLASSPLKRKLTDANRNVSHEDDAESVEKDDVVQTSRRKGKGAAKRDHESEAETEKKKGKAGRRRSSKNKKQMHVPSQSEASDPEMELSGVMKLNRHEPVDPFELSALSTEEPSTHSQNKRRGKTKVGRRKAKSPRGKKVSKRSSDEEEEEEEEEQQQEEVLEVPGTPDLYDDDDDDQGLGAGIAEGSYLETDTCLRGSTNNKPSHARVSKNIEVDSEVSQPTILGVLVEVATPPTVTKRRKKPKDPRKTLFEKSVNRKKKPAKEILSDHETSDSTALVPSPTKKARLLSAGSTSEASDGESRKTTSERKSTSGKKKEKGKASGRRVSIAPSKNTFFSPLMIRGTATPTSTPRSILKHKRVRSVSEPRMSSSSPLHIYEVTTSKTPLPPQAKGVTIIHPKPLGDKNLRRSCRNRVKPLDWFRNERPKYEHRKSGGLVLAGVYSPTLSQTEQQQRQKKRAKLKLQKKLKQKTKPPPRTPINLSIHGKLPENSDVVETSALPVINPDTEEEVLVDCIKHKDEFQYVGPGGGEPKTSDPLILSKMIRQKAFSVGQLILRPLQEKNTQFVRNDTMVFVIKYGKLAVTIHTKCSILETDDIFFVPKGNTYSVRNLRDEEAKIWFFQHKG